MEQAVADTYLVLIFSRRTEWPLKFLVRLCLNRPPLSKMVEKMMAVMKPSARGQHFSPFS